MLMRRVSLLALASGTTRFASTKRLFLPDRRAGFRCYDRVMSAVLDRTQNVLPSRFAWLMGLYGENHERLVRLFAPQRLETGSYRSSVGDGLDLRLDILERHRYTLDLHLTYAFVDATTGEPAPSAQLRMYNDAHVAEVLACCADRRLISMIGELEPARTVFEKRLQRSTFLSRWLEYLGEQGHSLATLEIARRNEKRRPSASPVTVAKHVVGALGT